VGGFGITDIEPLASANIMLVCGKYYKLTTPKLSVANCEP